MGDQPARTGSFADCPTGTLHRVTRSNRARLRLVVIDNYDSFTHNLVQYLELLGARCDVLLNDQTQVQDIAHMAPDGVLISPGPGSPDTAGITLEAVSGLAGRTPLLGVCLGHQAIAQCYGARVIRARRPMHGRASPVEHDGRTLFRGLPNPLMAGRYHSLIVEEAALPNCLEVSARSPDGEIMALRHRELALEGVQFHPESILSDHGLQMMQNWLEMLR